MSSQIGRGDGNSPRAHSHEWALRISNGLNSFTLFNLLDDAIADIFCLETYRHGTSVRNYNQIILEGADPTKGGSGGENAFHTAIEHTRVSIVD